MGGGRDLLDEMSKITGVKPVVPKIVPTKNPFDVDSILDEVEGGLSEQESGGNTRAVNRRTNATGQFQVLPSNIPNWTQKYLGKSLSVEEFKANPEAQRQVFRGEFGKYLNKALPLAKGDKDKAIRMAAAGWYGGERAMRRFDDPVRFRPDEPSFREYTTSVLSKIRKQPKNKPVDTASLLSEMQGLTAQTPQIDTASMLEEMRTITGVQPTFANPQIPQTVEAPEIIKQDNFTPNSTLSPQEQADLAQLKPPIPPVLTQPVPAAPVVPVQNVPPVQAPIPPEQAEIQKQYNEWLAANAIPDSAEARTQFNEIWKGLYKDINARNREAVRLDQQNQQPVPTPQNQIPQNAARQVQPTSSKQAQILNDSDIGSSLAGQVKIDLTKRPKNIPLSEFIYRSALSQSGLNQTEVDRAVNAYKSRGVEFIENFNPDEFADSKSVGFQVTRGDISLARTGDPNVLDERVKEDFQREQTDKSMNLATQDPIKSTTTQREMETQARSEDYREEQAQRRELESKGIDFDLYKQAEAYVVSSPTSGGTQADIDKQYELLKNAQVSDETKAWLATLGRGVKESSSGVNEMTAAGAGTLLETIGDYGAGIVRPFANFSSRFEGLYSSLQQLGNGARILKAESNPGDTLGNINQFVGSAAVEVPKYIALSALPGGAIVGFGLDAALRSSGQGKNPLEIGKDTAKGLMLGGIFKGAGKVQELAEKGLLSALLPKAEAEAIRRGLQTGSPDVMLASKVFGTTARLGTIGSGTFTLEKSFGASNEEAFKQAVVMTLFDLAMNAKGIGQITDLAGKVFRMTNPKTGETGNYTVTPKGEVLQLKGEVPKEAVDAEFDVSNVKDVEIGKDGVYRVKGDVEAKTEAEPLKTKLLKGAEIVEKPIETIAEKPVDISDQNVRSNDITQQNIKVKDIGKNETKIPEPQPEISPKEVEKTQTLTAEKPLASKLNEVAFESAQKGGELATQAQILDKGFEIIWNKSLEKAGKDYDLQKKAELQKTVQTLDTSPQKVSTDELDNALETAKRGGILPDFVAWVGDKDLSDKQKQQVNDWITDEDLDIKPFEIKKSAKRGELEKVEGGQFPQAKETVDGRVVRKKIPNQSSIDATLDNYKILPGVREVSIDEFDTDGAEDFGSADDKQRVRDLAEEIKQNNEISPLIVVKDKEGLYVLEGGHRLAALKELDAKSFPALIVEDKGIGYEVARDNRSEDKPFFVKSKSSPDIISRHKTAEEAWEEADRLSNGGESEPNKLSPTARAELRRTGTPEQLAEQNIKPLGEKGRFGQISHKLRKAMESADSTLTKDLADVFAPDVDLTSKHSHDAILDAISEQVGKDRSSQLDLDNWKTVLENNADKLSDESIDTILGALNHQVEWFAQRAAFADSKEFSDILDRANDEIGLGGITEYKQIPLKIRKEILALGRQEKYGKLSDAAIKEAFNEAITAVQGTIQKSTYGRKSEASKGEDKTDGEAQETTGGKQEPSGRLPAGSGVKKFTDETAIIPDLVIERFLADKPDTPGFAEYAQNKLLNAYQANANFKKEIKSNAGRDALLEKWLPHWFGGFNAAKTKIKNQIAQGTPLTPLMRERLKDYPDLQTGTVKEGRIVGGGEVNRDVQRRNLAERAANTNAVSGLPNRRAFDKALPKAERDTKTSVGVFDLDNFKAANDLKGHEYGDSLIKLAGESISKASKEFGGRDAFHFGGDEFAILPRTENGQNIIDRASELFGEHRVGDKIITLSGSLGDNFNSADTALHNIKKAKKIAVAEKSGLTATDREGRQIKQAISVSLSELDTPAEKRLYKTITTLYTRKFSDSRLLGLAKSEIRNGDLYLNPYAAEFLRRVLVNDGDLAGDSPLFGAYLEPHHIETALKYAKNNPLNLPQRFTQTADRIISDLAKSSKNEYNDSVIIVNSEQVPEGFKVARQEELGHRGDFRTRGFKSMNAQRFLANPKVNEVKSVVEEDYKGLSDDDISAEIVAKTVRDDAKQVLKTDDDGIGEIWSGYVDELFDLGISAAEVEKHFSGISKSGEKLIEYAFIRGKNIKQNRAGRQAEVRPDNEGGGKISESKTTSISQSQYAPKRNTDDLADFQRRSVLERTGNADEPKPDSSLIKRSKIHLAKTSEEPKAVAKKLFNQIYEGRGENATPKKEVIVNFRRAGLLTSPKTHLRNILSNVAFQASEEAIRPVAILADLAASAVSGKRTIQAPSVPAIYKSFAALVRQDPTIRDLKGLSELEKKSGIKRAWSILKNGDIKELEKNQLAEMKSGSPILDKFINGVFRLLGASDALFKTYAMRRSLEEQAKTIAITKSRKLTFKNYLERRKYIAAQREELLTNPTNEMALEAMTYADFTTFTNNNPISDWFTKIKDVNPTGKAILEIAIPYDRTPTNIILRTLEYTPVGFLMSGKHLIDWKRGTSYTIDQLRKGFEQHWESMDKGRKEVRGLLDQKIVNLLEDGGRLEKEIERLENVEDRTIAQSKRLIELQRQLAERKAKISTYGRVRARRGAKDMFREQNRKEIDDALKNIFPRIQQQQFDRTFGRAGFGSSALALGIYLAMNGLLSGVWDAGEKDESAEFYKRREQGILNGSIKIGSRRFQINDTPLGKTMVLGASIWERSQMKPKKGETKTEKAFGDIYDVGSEMVFEQPLLNAMQDYFGSNKSIEKRIGGLLGSFVPSILSDVADVTDDEARQNERLFDATVNRTPFIRNFNKENKFEREPFLQDRTNRLLNKFDPLNSRPVLNEKEKIEQRIGMLEKKLSKSKEEQKPRLRDMIDRLKVKLAEK